MSITFARMLRSFFLFFPLIFFGIGAKAEINATLANQLVSSNRLEIRDAIAAVANSGDARAMTLLNALGDGSLKNADGKAVIERENHFYDALTDTELAGIEAAKAPLLNNLIRRSLDSALGFLKLTVADDSIRLQAAATMFGQISEENASAVRSVIAKEKNPEIKSKLQLALASFDIQSPDKSRKIAAFSAIAEAGDSQLKSLVESALAKDSTGKYIENDEDIISAAKSALSSIKNKEIILSICANSLYGLSLGSVLLLAALGLAITFGLMGVINMAHGEMVMLGAYATFVVQNFFRQHLTNYFDFYLMAAVPVAFLVPAVVGAVVERSVIRFLYGRPLETLLATWGISLLLIQTVRLIFGAQNVEVENPSWLSGGLVLLPNLTFPYSRIATIGFAIFVVTLVWTIFQKTTLGLQVRAVSQNRAMAACMGINTGRLDCLTFALGSGIAGLGGVVLSQLGNVGPELGQSYIVDSFMVVVLGGVGKIAGTVAGALGLGVINKILEPTFGAVLGKILVLVFIILFIQKRPQGIFALKGREVDA